MGRKSVFFVFSRSLILFFPRRSPWDPADPAPLGGVPRWAARRFGAAIVAVGAVLVVAVLVVAVLVVAVLVVAVLVVAVLVAVVLVAVAVLVAVVAVARRLSDGSLPSWPSPWLCASRQSEGRPSSRTAGPRGPSLVSRPKAAEALALRCPALILRAGTARRRDRPDVLASHPVPDDDVVTEDVGDVGDRGQCRRPCRHANDARPPVGVSQRTGHGHA